MTRAKGAFRSKLLRPDTGPHWSLRPPRGQPEKWRSVHREARRSGRVAGCGKGLTPMVMPHLQKRTLKWAAVNDMTRRVRPDRQEQQGWDRGEEDENPEYSGITRHKTQTFPGVPVHLDIFTP